MPGGRNNSQKVETFSASTELLRKAQLAAKSRGLTKSGFYRYCLAKELGMGEEAALRIAEHAAIGRFNVVGDGNMVGGSGNTQINATPSKYPKKPRKK
ncbi:hypothetical protein BH09VER1_BH09VER1_28600 [soil metagenome]